MRARLSELGAEDELLQERLSLELACWTEQELEPADGRPSTVEARIQLSEGTNSALGVEAGVLDVVASLDGGTPLGDVIRAVGARRGLSKNEVSRLERATLEAARELLELGALEC